MRKGGGTNDLVRTISGFMVAFLATVFTDKSSLGINFAGIVEVASNTDLSDFHFLDQRTKWQRLSEGYTHTTFSLDV